MLLRQAWQRPVFRFPALVPGGYARYPAVMMTQASRLAVVLGAVLGTGCANPSPPPRNPGSPGSASAGTAAPSGANLSTVTLSTTSELPRPNTQPDAVVAVQIKADGSVFVDAKRIAGAQAIGASIDAAHPGDHSKLQALVYADGEARYGSVIPVLDALRRDGVTRIGIVVRPPDEKKAEVSAPPRPGATASASPPPSAAAPPARPNEPPPDEPPGKLPEVTVENIGLHIGGGPNDDASKAPYRKAIEPHFDDFRACYVKVAEPAKGGTFGVDLRVGRNGGKPEVRQPRTGMKGKGFRDCMVSAFQGIDLPAPHKPLVFSYSLRFRVGK